LCVWVSTPPIVVLLLFSVLATGCTVSRSADPPGSPTVEVVLTALHNPRGVGVDVDGALLVAEAGLGDDARDVTDRTGKMTRFVDRNGNGYFGDPGEAETWFEHLASYNAMNLYATGRDEVSGPSDVAMHTDGRSFLSVDGGFEEFALFEISSTRSMGRNLASRSNMTGVALSEDEESLFVSESTLNQLIEITLETGARRKIVTFPELGSGQQSVPAGLAIDPRDGGVLVALFSGVAESGDGNFIPFVSGDSKIVRVDPLAGTVTDEIIALTTAVDVAVDEFGNVFVVELASGYADLLEHGADLFDPEAVPLHGGYRRYSGTVTMYPSDAGRPIILARGLDAPTNITVAPDGTVYVSTGQGTPGRPIPGPDGPTKIVGEVIRIRGY
jgi:sugar lactone lactonase YvrE